MPSLPASFFSMPPGEFPTDVWNKLSKVYETPSDIELFPGGMSETRMEGALVGPTFACLINTQFKLLKGGDRYVQLATKTMAAIY